MAKKIQKATRSRKASKITIKDMVKLKALGDAQDEAIKYYDNGDNLVLTGSAGTGKTFLAIAKALEEVLDPDTEYKSVLIIRSIVPCRNIGFLPGTEEEKLEVYTRPYQDIVRKLFKVSNAWTRLTDDGIIRFDSTSFVRGQTWDRTIVVVDEVQNLNFHECDSVITRMGTDCRIIFAGDYYQSDFEKQKDKSGLLHFMKILENMHNFSTVAFTWKDIVRSGTVREFIMTKEKMIKDGTLPPDL